MSFKDEIHAMPTRAGVPELHEKIEILSKVSQSNTQDDDALDRELHDNFMPDLAESDESAPQGGFDAEDGTEVSFNIVGKERIRLAQAFMIESGTDFQWLLQQMETAAGMMTTGSTEAHIRNHLVDLIDHNTGIRLELNWSPVEFLTDQYRSFSGVECRLQEVICFCGADNDVQALSCEDYARKLWPELCLSLLEYISSAIDRGVGTYKGNLTLYSNFLVCPLTVSRFHT